jgi:hypothetical protein
MLSPEFSVSSSIHFGVHFTGILQGILPVFFRGFRAVVVTCVSFNALQNGAEVP